jgi:hypothetical protein
VLHDNDGKAHDLNGCDSYLPRPRVIARQAAPNAHGLYAECVGTARPHDAWRRVRGAERRIAWLLENIGIVDGWGPLEAGRAIAGQPDLE